MSIQNHRQLENTRQKLKELEERRAALSVDSVAEEEAYSRSLTIRSYGNLIKQLKEEIARFEARATLRANVE